MIGNGFDPNLKFAAFLDYILKSHSSRLTCIGGNGAKKYILGEIHE